MAVHLAGFILLKKIDSSSPSYYNILMTPQLGTRFSVHFPPSILGCFVLLELVQILFLLLQLLGVHMCIHPVVSEKQNFHEVIYNLWFLPSSCPLFLKIPSS